MILVGQYDSPYARRVAVTLHHYKMPFTRDTKSVFADAKEMQKINPLIRIPSLILETGETLIDSSAIIDHLDEMAGPARALIPPHGPGRRKVLQAVSLALGTTDKAVQVFYERHFHTPKTVSREWEGRCLMQLGAGLERLEATSGAPWLFDLHMSHADIMTGCLIGFLKLRVPEAFPANKLPKLHALALRCEMTPEFIKAQTGEDETAPKLKHAH